MFKETACYRKQTLRYAVLRVSTTILSLAASKEIINCIQEVLETKNDRNRKAKMNLEP